MRQFSTFSTPPTGKPKGVLIEHHSVVRMVAGAAGPLDYAPGCISTLVASTNFDASVLEIFLALLHGGTLVIAPEDARRDPDRLHALLARERITHTILAPVLLQGLPRRALPNLRLLAFGGDTLDETAARWWAKQTRLFSLYGPTEATVMATAGQIAPEARVRVLGKPLPGYDDILDVDRQRTPAGSVGELCIGGENLSRGYRNEPELTLGRFVADPFVDRPYARMYRTGDLGRYLEDGTIKYFGRNDAQIKLRGFRIELGAKSKTGSRACPAWKARPARCVAKASSATSLRTTWCARAHTSARKRCARNIAVGLPDYMAPALREDGRHAAVRFGQNRLPRAGLETRIAAVWCALLNIDRVGREDDLFHLGGNSILAMRMHARAETGIEFALPAFYHAPTIATLAAGGEQDDIARAIADADASLAAIDGALPAWRASDETSMQNVVANRRERFRQHPSARRTEPQGAAGVLPAALCVG